LVSTARAVSAGVRAGSVACAKASQDSGPKAKPKLRALAFTKVEK
jgi:hypothetical protein